MFQLIMKRAFPSLFLVAAFFALSQITGSGQTNTIVIPREAETKFGDGWAYAFAYGNAYSERIYAASEFSPVATDLILITQVAFRLDEAYPEGNDADWRVRIDMNSFPGAMDEIGRRMSGVTNPVTVFPEQIVHFSARGGMVEAFDFSFPLETPFVYDRRIGPLVLSIYAGKSGLIDLDGQSVPILGSTPQRAMSIIVEPDGPKRIHTPAVMQCSYLTRWARILDVNNLGSALEIKASIFNSSDRMCVQEATSASGPYVNRQELQLNGAGEETTTIRVPISGAARFFRLRLE